MSNGDYVVEILMTNKKGESLLPFSWGFTIGNAREESKGVVSYKGGVSNRLSSENVSGSILNIAEIQGKFDIDFNWAQLNFVSRVTSRETPYLQPQNPAQNCRFYLWRPGNRRGSASRSREHPRRHNQR